MKTGLPLLIQSVISSILAVAEMASALGDAAARCNDRTSGFRRKAWERTDARPKRAILFYAWPCYRSSFQWWALFFVMLATWTAEPSWGQWDQTAPRGGSPRSLLDNAASSTSAQQQAGAHLVPIHQLGKQVSKPVVIGKQRSPVADPSVSATNRQGVPTPAASQGLEVLPPPNVTESSKPTAESRDQNSTARAPDIANDDLAQNNDVPSLSIGYRQESLPPTKQQKGSESDDVDEGVVRLLKPLNVDPKASEVLSQRYPDGKLQIERRVVRDQFGNYLNDGKWKMYHTDGQLMGLGRFDNGQMIGVWQRVHFSRDSAWFQTADFQGFEFPLVSTADFKDGQMDGLWVIKDSQQRKIFQLAYRDGRRQGTGSWWHSNGQLKRQLQCRDDLLHGQWQEWDENGKLVRENWFREGRRISKNTSYFRENRPEVEQSYLEPKLELVEADDWWNARLGSYEPTGEVVQEGPVRAWYDNGQRHMAGFFEDGMKEGEFAWWHPNGTRKLLGHYDQGQRTGRWTWWHDNGIKAAEVDFEKDLPVSTLLTWDENGVEQLSPETVLDGESRRSTARPGLLDQLLDEESDGSLLPAPSKALELEPEDEAATSLEEMPSLNLESGADGNGTEELEELPQVRPTPELDLTSPGTTGVKDATGGEAN